MQMTVTNHEAWLARPEDLRHVLALLAGLESPAARFGLGEGRPAACGAERLQPARGL